MDFEQAKKVLQLTDARIRKFGSIDPSTNHEIHEAIFRFQPFQRLVIAHHAFASLLIRPDASSCFDRSAPTPWRGRKASLAGPDTWQHFRCI